MSDIVINTDGARTGNPGPGGFAAIIEIDGREVTITVGQPGSTNNAMELAAVIKAIDYLRRNTGLQGRTIEVRSDSTYVTNAFNKGWLRKWKNNGRLNDGAMPNRVKWQILATLTSGLSITWTWVRGHSGDPMNERCDRLAVRMAQEAVNRTGYFRQDDGSETQPDVTEPAVSHDEQGRLELQDGSPVQKALQLNSRAAPH